MVDRLMICWIWTSTMRGWYGCVHEACRDIESRKAEATFQTASRVGKDVADRFIQKAKISGLEITILVVRESEVRLG